MPILSATSLYDIQADISQHSQASKEERSSLARFASSHRLIATKTASLQKLPQATEYLVSTCHLQESQLQPRNSNQHRSNLLQENLHLPNMPLAYSLH